MEPGKVAWVGTAALLVTGDVGAGWFCFGGELDSLLDAIEAALRAFTHLVVLAVVASGRHNYNKWLIISE